MQFRIIDAERQVGGDVDLIVEAPTPSATKQHAIRMNVLVERIKPAGVTPSSAPPSPVPPAGILERGEQVVTVQARSKRYKGM